MNWQTSRRIIGSVVLTLSAAALLRADVDLEWRPDVINGEHGEVIEVGLYAVSDSEVDEAFFGDQVIVEWDASIITLLGVIDDGPYTWLASFFPDDSGGDGLNNTFDDGDAWYLSLAQFVVLPVATPEGLLITTFQFEIVAEDGVTMIEIPLTSGAFTTTAVFDDLVPGAVITGELGTAMVVVGGGGGCASPGDFDADGDVDLVDFGRFQLCYTSILGEPISPDCACGNFDGDDNIDLADFAGFTLAFTGSL